MQPGCVKRIQAVDRLGDDEAGDPFEDTVDKLETISHDEAEALWKTVAGLERTCAERQEKLVTWFLGLRHRVRCGLSGGRAFGVPARGRHSLGAHPAFLGVSHAEEVHGEDAEGARVWMLTRWSQRWD